MSRIVRIDSADAVIAAARPVGNGALLEGFGRDALQQRNFGLQVVEIVDGEFDFAAGLGAARLQGGASGKNEDQVCAPGAEGDPEAALETGAVGEQQHDGRDAPRHAEHGEDAAAAVVLERVVGLAGEFENHKFFRRDSRPRFQRGPATVECNETLASCARLDTEGGCPYVHLVYSWRRASTGCSSAAWRAG